MKLSSLQLWGAGKETSARRDSGFPGLHYLHDVRVTRCGDSYCYSDGSNNSDNMNSNESNTVKYYSRVMQKIAKPNQKQMEQMNKELLA